MGINTSPYQNGDPRIGLGIVQSLTSRIGLGFVPNWDFRVSSPNWNGIQNGDPISERGSPCWNGDSPNWFPNRGVPESVWGSFQFGDQHIYLSRVPPIDAPLSRRVDGISGQTNILSDPPLHVGHGDADYYVIGCCFRGDMVSLC